MLGFENKVFVNDVLEYFVNSMANKKKIILISIFDF
jgi:hypothetical protein